MVSWLDDLRVLSLAMQNKQALSVCEDKWYHKFIAQIKIHNMILPRVGLYFCFPSAERWCISVLWSVVVFQFSRSVCRRSPSRQSQSFYRATEELVTAATKMQVDWIITHLVSSYFGSLALREVAFIWKWLFLSC